MSICSPRSILVQPRTSLRMSAVRTSLCRTLSIPYRASSGRPVHVCSFSELFPGFSRTLRLSIRPQGFHSFSRCPFFVLAPPHLCGLVCPFVAIPWRVRPFLTRAPAASAVAAFSHFLIALFFMFLRVCGFVHACSLCVLFSRISSHSCLFILMALYGPRGQALYIVVMAACSSVIGSTTPVSMLRPAA